MKKTKKPLTSYMKKKRREKKNEYAREYYKRNKAKLREANRRNYKKRKLEAEQLIVPDTNYNWVKENYSDKGYNISANVVTDIKSITQTEDEVKIVVGNTKITVSYSDNSMRFMIHNH
tara:strand:+ start:1552 stop:1905 length:354 start_codon:yes stop_codon:yes gene_type:complete